MICSSVPAFSLSLASINFGRFRASCSTNSSSSFWPRRPPLGSVTFSAEFFPLRSTMIPLLSSTRMSGGNTLPSRSAFVGRYFSPPRAQAMASSTLVLPCPFLPPMTVRPFAVGSSCTARTLLTFSNANRLIFTLM